MAQIVYRGNLSVKQFPFLTDFQGSSIIVAGPDNTFNRSLTSVEDVDKDVGIPIVYYGHNVLPAGYGFVSVGYDVIIPQLSPAISTFSSADLLRSNAISAGVNGPRFYFAPQPNGTHYTLVIGSTTWSAISTSVPYTAGAQISYATLQGISYIYFPGVGCYKWNSATNTLIAVTLTGLSVGTLLGITTYQGYMVAFDANNIFWSSVLDIDYTLNTVDFTPSLVSGAGNIRPEGARGPITIVLPATFGLAVYTSANIVSAIYSGNSRYPFNFKEVVSSGGCSSSDLVSYDANTGNQYAYTTSGMQTVTATATQTVFPEVTDFLAGQEFEDFDETTLIFSRQTLTVPMFKKLVAIADRYLVMSYGVASLTHALVYDMTLKRWGKLKISHVDCFEYQYLDSTLSDAPRKSIAFLKPDGTVYIANLSVTNALSKGVLMVGKFQYVRARKLTLEELRYQTVGVTQTCITYDYVSNSGGTIESTVRSPFYDATPAGEQQRIGKIHKTGTNHSILWVGGFSLSSFVLTFHIAGKR